MASIPGILDVLIRHNVPMHADLICRTAAHVARAHDGVGASALRRSACDEVRVRHFTAGFPACEPLAEPIAVRLSLAPFIRGNPMAARARGLGAQARRVSG